jgi:hypothetical protein
MRCKSLLIVAASLTMSTICYSADPETVRAKQTKFVDAYVAALHAKHFQKEIALLHPKVRQCVTERNRAFFEAQYARQSKRTPAGNPSNVSFTALIANAAPLGASFLPGDSFSYPVKPTYTAQLDFPAVGNSSYTALLEIAEDRGDLYLAVPCPTEKGMDLFEAQQKKRAQQQAEANKLASEVKDPLRSELLQLLKDQHKIWAVRAYEKATNRDETTAVMVIEALQEKPND